MRVRTKALKCNSLCNGTSPTHACSPHCFEYPLITPAHAKHSHRTPHCTATVPCACMASLCARPRGCVNIRVLTVQAGMYTQGSWAGGHTNDNSKSIANLLPRRACMSNPYAHLSFKPWLTRSVRMPSQCAHPRGCGSMRVPSSTKLC